MFFIRKGRNPVQMVTKKRKNQSLVRNLIMIIIITACTTAHHYVGTCEFCKYMNLLLKNLQHIGIFLLCTYIVINALLVKNNFLDTVS